MMPYSVSNNTELDDSTGLQSESPEVREIHLYFEAPAGVFLHAEADRDVGQNVFIFLLRELGDIPLVL